MPGHRAGQRARAIDQRIRGPRLARQPGAHRARQRPEGLRVHRLGGVGDRAQRAGIGRRQRRFEHRLVVARRRLVGVDALDEQPRGIRLAHPRQQQRALGDPVGGIDATRRADVGGQHPPQQHRHPARRDRRIEPRHQRVQIAPGGVAEAVRRNAGDRRIEDADMIGGAPRGFGNVLLAQGLGGFLGRIGGVVGGVVLRRRGDVRLLGRRRRERQRRHRLHAAALVVAALGGGCGRRRCGGCGRRPRRSAEARRQDRLRRLLSEGGNRDREQRDAAQQPDRELGVLHQAAPLSVTTCSI